MRERRRRSPTANRHYGLYRTRQKYSVVTETDTKTALEKHGNISLEEHEDMIVLELIIKVHRDRSYKNSLSTRHNSYYDIAKDEYSCEDRQF